MKNKTFQAKLAEVLSELENGVAQQVKDRMELKIVYRDANDIHNTALQAITAFIESDLIRQASDYTSTEGDDYAAYYNHGVEDTISEQRSILHDTGEKV